MQLNEIKKLNTAIQDLRKFASGGAVRKEQGRIDKFGTGFNLDNRFAMCCDHRISYDTWRGSFGNSDCDRQLRLDCCVAPIFWKCFDEYLNDHQDEILLAVARKMEMQMSKEVDVVKKEIKELNEFVDALENVKEETL